MRVSTDGPVHPTEAWRRYQRLALWPAWAPQIKTVIADGEQLAPGVAGRVVGPAGLSVNFVVLTCDPARHRWSWRVWRGPVAVTLEHGLDPAPVSGSRAWIDLHAPAPLRPLLLGYVPIAWYALHRLVTLEKV